MSKSLQDQLLALGLANKAAVTKQPGSHRSPAAKAKKNSQRAEAPKKATPAGKGQALSDSDLSLEQAYRLREKHTREEAKQARELKRMEDRKRRQLNQEIRTIVETHRLNDPAAELSRNFVYKGRIRKVNVTAGQLKALNEGALGLVYLGGGYHILQPEYVELVRSLSADHVPDLTSSVEEDDQYPVPDDLIW